MRRRIVVMTALVAVLSMALFAIPLGFGAYFYYRSHERDDLRRFAFGVAAAAPDNLSAGTELAELQHPRADYRLGLYDNEAHLVSGRGDSDAMGLVRRALTGQATRGEVHGRLAWAVPVRDAGTVSGAVLATAGTHHIRALALIWSSLLVLAALVLIVARYVASRLATRLARPIEELSANAARLGDANYSMPTGRGGIPEIDSLEQSIATASARLNVLIERERSLATAASHQLRTPLARLSLALDAARTAEDPGDAIREAQTVVAQLDGTVSDMLRLVRDDSPAETADITALLDHVAARWNVATAGSPRQLRFEVQSGLPEGVISAHAARQILDVLIDNTAQHGHGNVTVRVRTAGAALAIDVSQEGGPLRATTPDLFTDGDARGSGRGLRLARTIARSEGARLILTSKDPVTFTVLMPAVARSSSAASKRR